jgi:hypothetical protein
VRARQVVLWIEPDDDDAFDGDALGQIAQDYFVPDDMPAPTRYPLYVQGCAKKPDFSHECRCGGA